VQKLLTIHTTKIGTQESIESEVEARVQDAQNPILAYLGTVTDITESGLQIRTQSGEISQVSLAGTTSYANIVKDSQEVKFEDIALGDFVAALGTLNDNDLLIAQRVLVTLPPSDEEEFTIVKGKVDELSSSDFLVTDNESEQWSIDARGNVDVTAVSENGEVSSIKFADIADGDTIIIIGEMDDGELAASRVHKI
jgi:hypothetical protein